MRIIHTGNGRSGSWEVRGEQLGDHPKPKATRFDCDAVVVVKKPPHPALLKSGIPWAWDVVDFYPQPQCSSWSRSKSIAWVKSQLAKYRPNGVIFPNARMQEDCKTHIPSTVIYHHHRPGIAVNPIREKVGVVGYEGSPRYLGKWGDAILRECNRRGWEFQVNHGVHADWDICVAFRDRAFNGYPQYHWKSNVKLANCHGSGTPFIGPPEFGYTETATGLEQFIESSAQLSDALDRLENYDYRREVHEAFLQKAITVDDCKTQLRDFVSEIRNSGHAKDST